MRSACMVWLGLGVLAWAAEAGTKISDKARRALEQAEQMDFYSLEPNPGDRDKDDKEKNKAEEFHGWTVLGKTPLQAASTRRKLVAALEKGVSENDGSMPDCFRPRHGIRVKCAGQVYDYVVCFECLTAKVYVDDKPDKGFLTSASPQKVFDEILKEARVPLAKPGRE